VPAPQPEETTVTTKTSRRPRRLAELAKVDEQIAQAVGRERTTRARADAEGAKLPDLRARAQRSWADGNEQDAEQLEAEVSEIQRAMREVWGPRVRATEVAVAQMRAERRAFLERNGAELVAEAKPDALAVTDRLVRAAEDFLAAVRGYNVEAGRQSELAGDPLRRRFTFPNADHISRVAAAVEGLLVDDLIALPVPTPRPPEPAVTVPEGVPAHVIEP
jgi:hypothetical protein